MTAPPLQRTTFITGISSLLILGSVAYLFLSIGPALKTTRQDIDDRRATIIVISQERSNLQSLSHDIDNVKSQQADLDRHIWSFLDEDKFFSLWSSLATDNHVAIDQPNIADTTPTHQPISRAVTLHISGTLPNILTAINAIQKIEPVIFIMKVAIKNGATLASVLATVEAQTVWQ